MDYRNQDQPVDISRKLGQTSASSVLIPAGAGILQIYVRNTTANAITGGLKIGTSAGADDVVSALAVDAAAFTFVADTALLKRVFSMSLDQTLYFDAVTDWNSANIDIYVTFANLRM